SPRVEPLGWLTYEYLSQLLTLLLVSVLGFKGQSVEDFNYNVYLDDRGCRLMCR
ncbi:hypothetical protein HAX54_040619, partial [Datura stramonium]|nr:hypothetical protein [Datura stramonium]